MSNDKKITKAKSQLEEAQAERARKKALYDAHLKILRGQRNVVINLEERARVLEDEYNAEHTKVDLLIKEVGALTDEKAQELDKNGTDGQKDN